MYKNTNKSTLHFPPSDLTTYVDSQFPSWLDHYTIKHDDGRFQKDTEDELGLEL